MVRESHDHLPRFDVDVVIEPDAHRIRVAGSVVVPSARTQRDALEFLLRTDVDGLQIDVVDPPECRGPLTVQEGEPVPNMAVTRRHEAVLPAPCPPDVPLVLSFGYVCGSEENRRWLHITRQFSFSSFYASAWVPGFGFRRGTGIFRYSVPDGMVVEATGNLVSVNRGDDMTVYTFVAEIPSVFDFVAGTFTVQRREGTVPISIYHLEPLPQADEILDRTERILGVLESEFGPYPFDELAVVEVPMEPAVFAGIEGGAYPGYFLIRSDLLQADSLEDWVVGHELTHFWFPHVVGHKEEAIAPAMLDEALAHYGALRVVEAIEGSVAAARFRREGAREAIRLTAAGFEHRLAGQSSTDRWDRVAYNLSNTKGHLVYDMLARTMGRERFRAAMRRVLAEHAGGEIGWSDFWTTLEEASDEPLDWFSAQWLESAALPILSLEWTQEGDRLTCVVTQSAPHFRLDVPLQVELADGNARIWWVSVMDEQTEEAITTEGIVHDVRLDPHATIVHATPSEWEEAVGRGFVTRGRMLWDDDDFDEAGEVFAQGLEQIPEVDVWGVEFLTRFYLGWLHQSQGRLDDASAQYEMALSCAVRPADLLGRLYLNIATVAKERGDGERMRWAAREAVNAERLSGAETDVSRTALQMYRTAGTDQSSTG